MEMFYEQPENLGKLHALIDELIKDKYTEQQIKDFFYNLGYDIFFVDSKVLAYINSKH